MGSIGTAEIIVVMIAALLILGPQKLPGAARQVGKAVSEFRRMANGFQADVKEAFSEDAEPPRYPGPPAEPARYEPPAIAATGAPPADEPPSYEPPSYEPPTYEPPSYPSSAADDDDSPTAFTPPGPARDADLPSPPDDPTRN